MLLTILEEMSDNLLSLDANRLHEELAGPTLIHLEGKNKEPLFLSVLLHGNETSGWIAIQSILKRLKGKLPRSLSLFIGNVEAARHNCRHLENQADYNRIWNGGDSAEEKMAMQILEMMRQRKNFASIDLHNNTGQNPFYACVNVPRGDHLNLAHLFGNVIVYFTQPDSVLSMAMSEICPAVTVECGQSAEIEGVKAASQYIEKCLNLNSIPDLPVDNISLYHTVATITVLPDIEFSFNRENTGLIFAPELEGFNFKEIAPGTQFASYEKGAKLPFKVKNEARQDVGHEYFEVNNGQILTKKTIMPSMLTTNVDIVRQDCLCYLMEKMVLS